MKTLSEKTLEDIIWLVVMLLLLLMCSCTSSAPEHCTEPRYLIRTEYGVYEACDKWSTGEYVNFYDMKTGHRIQANFYQLEEIKP